MQGMTVLYYHCWLFASDHTISRPSSYHYLYAQEPRLFPFGGRNDFHNFFHLPTEFPVWCHTVLRLVEIWVAIKRPMLRQPSQEEPATSSEQSLLIAQKPYLKRHVGFHGRKLGAWSEFLNGASIALAFAGCLSSFGVIALLVFGVCCASIWYGFHHILAAGVLFGMVALITAIGAFLLHASSDYSLGLPLLHFYSFANFMYETRGYDTGDTKQLIIEGIMATLRQRKAKLDQDKSYALYGILQNLGLELSEVGYRKPQGCVYHDLMIDLLHWHPWSLLALMDAGRDDDDERLTPAEGELSWVPDWSNIPPKPTIPTHYLLQPQRKVFEMPESFIPWFRLDSGNRKLVISGSSESEVIYCTDRFPLIDYQVVHSSMHADHGEIPNSLHQDIETFASWVQIVQLTSRELCLRESYTSTDTRGPHWYWWNGFVSNSVMSTQECDVIDIHLVINRASRVFKHDEGLGKLEKIIHMFRTTAAKCSRTDAGPRPSFETILSRNLIVEEQLMVHFIELVNDLSINRRRLFVTSDNRLGCVSYGMAAGNKVLYADYLPMPLILRRANLENGSDKEEYRVMCAAFVLDWLDGSCLRSMEPSHITLI